TREGAAFLVALAVLSRARPALADPARVDIRVRGRIWVALSARRLPASRSLRGDCRAGRCRLVGTTVLLRGRDAVTPPVARTTVAARLRRDGIGLGVFVAV